MVATGTTNMYSQAYQDKFVDNLLSHPKTGYFVDVGAGTDPSNDGSNTLMFEQRGWDGIAIDMDAHRMVNRNCKTVACKIGNVNDGGLLLGDILKSNNVPTIVDYLSIDLEGSDLDALRSFIESGYRFKVLTIEHNLYSMNPGVGELKRDIFLFLTQHDYVRVGDNIGHQATKENFYAGWAFEDWYIDPTQVSYTKAIKILRGEE
jgi:hypothetical protein